MTYSELKKDLDAGFKQWTKKDFIEFCMYADGRTRVGGPKGKGRLTSKKALALLASK